MSPADYWYEMAKAAARDAERLRSIIERTERSLVEQSDVQTTLDILGEVNDG